MKKFKLFNCLLLVLMVLFCLGVLGCAGSLKNYNETLKKIPNATFEKGTWDRQGYFSSSVIKVEDAIYKDGKLELGSVYIKETAGPMAYIIFSVEGYKRQVRPPILQEEIILEANPESLIPVE
ncbi:MAG: hypothetical protein GY797_01540 [Deltaproteobacteria bacterium]|nr:hypothetical protein [Deltaproteobacteria bacterium]